MIVRCEKCGCTREPTWRDGKYYCVICGEQINEKAMRPGDVENDEGASSPQIGAAVKATQIKVVCPICRNAENNTLENGHCRCSLCASVFDLPQSQQTASGERIVYVPTPAANSAQREDLEKKRSNALVWAIVWLILFWPVSIYFFVKYANISKEISNL